MSVDCIFRPGDWVIQTCTKPTQGSLPEVYRIGLVDQREYHTPVCWRDVSPKIGQFDQHLDFITVEIIR